VDEGEGFTTLTEWRVAHEAYWDSEEVRAGLPPGFRLDDATEVVLEGFRVVD
jgi:uncharacterized protein YhfF